VENVHYACGQWEKNSKPVLPGLDKGMNAAPLHWFGKLLKSPKAVDFW
jgi:hypothetical protein